jgi:hypothetical protein
MEAGKVRSGVTPTKEEEGMLKITVACGLALALLGTLALEASAQSSCGGWYPVCKKRCVAQKISCGHCDDLLATCRTTGCWTEGKNYGGAKHCGLKKS